ncbi:hypothetical protein BTA51_11965 [Hahella sp. CCB-MM4]|uniref:helix-turn-helix domain-containing protein n=1 Tax=Hahella sp. (strain CCB-MM4) TaxID=1926491 RepID=UPI000B9AD6F8|nr:helix-turn-helix domain-containing protein [Hahella sp. CCB-MM4]OZG73193.1 hypothetical protein BTA51_11965 [Hahella sp. CCB-MM4]
MQRTQLNNVRDALNGSKATQLDYCVLNQDLSLAHWSNQRDRVSYHKVGHHTVSLYLTGGNDTHRLDMPSAGKGSPGKLCLMPATQDSEWVVGEGQEFVHFYVSDAALKFFALESFDIDPRLVRLPDLTFADHPELARLCHSVMNVPWHAVSERLHLQQAFYGVMGCLIQAFVRHQPVTEALRGGLSRRQLTSVMEYIHAHAGEEIHLEKLATVSGLSLFHFARMFKQSTGLTPHQYVSKIRVRKGMEMLQKGYGQAYVAAACGFSHQSHFAAQFKREYGVTPARLIRELC